MLHQGLNIVSQLQIQELLLRPMRDQLCKVLGLLANLADEEGDNDLRYPILLGEIFLCLTVDDGPVGDFKLVFKAEGALRPGPPLS